MAVYNFSVGGDRTSAYKGASDSPTQPMDECSKDGYQSRNQIGPLQQNKAFCLKKKIRKQMTIIYTKNNYLRPFQCNYPLCDLVEGFVMINQLANNAYLFS